MADRPSTESARERNSETEPHVWKVRSEGRLYTVSMGGSEKMTTINGQKRSINFLNRPFSGAPLRGSLPSKFSSRRAKIQLLRVYLHG